MSIGESVLVALFCFVMVFMVLFFLFLILKIFTHGIVWYSRRHYQEVNDKGGK